MERKILSRGSTWGGEEGIPNSPSFSIPQIRNKAASRGTRVVTVGPAVQSKGSGLQRPTGPLATRQQDVVATNKSKIDLAAPAVTRATPLQQRKGKWLKRHPTSPIVKRQEQVSQCQGKADTGASASAGTKPAQQSKGNGHQILTTKQQTLVELSLRLGMAIQKYDMAAVANLASKIFGESGG